MDRVIVVMPYLAIIEQNAQRIRDAVGAEAVLEHHSAAEDEAEDDESPSGPCAGRRLAAENWDAPVVITTAVQFFESLFSNRPSRCRKLHRIARAVVILDEVQVLPPKLLSGTLGMVQALCRDYGTSFVFCTATQDAGRENVP